MLDKQSLVELADIYKEKYNRLIKDNAELERQIDEANAEIERLREERDEARKLFCEDRFHNGKHHRSVNGDLVVCASPQEIAADLGWDCFKENTND